MGAAETTRRPGYVPVGSKIARAMLLEWAKSRDPETRLRVTALADVADRTGWRVYGAGVRLLHKGDE